MLSASAMPVPPAGECVEIARRHRTVRARHRPHGLDIRALAAEERLPEDCPPGLRVWRLPASQEARILHHGPEPTASDRALAEHLHPPRWRQRWLATRGLLRLALSAQTGGAVSPMAWRFWRQRCGKPCIEPGQPQIQFNITHGPAGTLIAVSPGGLVGIDMLWSEQEIAPAFRQVAAPEELDALAPLGDAERNDAARRLWVLKEAYIKMLGSGFSTDPACLAFGLAPPRLSGPAPDQALRLHCWTTFLDGRSCVVALAMPREDGRPACPPFRIHLDKQEAAL